MRRGHPGIVGWRNDNPRRFRPRIGGTPHFRPSRPLLSLYDGPRFFPPGPRPPRIPQNYNKHHEPVKDQTRPDHHDRNKYRINNQNNQHVHQHQERGHKNVQRHSYPPSQQVRHNEAKEHSSLYGDTFNYYNRQVQSQVNSMGDVDHRQTFMLQNQESFNQVEFSPWSNPSMELKTSYGDHIQHNRSYKPQENNDVNKLPALEYTGHRPPSSDHYGSSTGPTIDSSNAFSHSVDDTVNIIRKRLLNRNESHQSTDKNILEDNHVENQTKTASNCQNVQQEQPTKKKIQRQKSSVKTNCDKIKDKIVHQLFKMDKGNIHKLIDNPSSSTKFEYAISSLITESQNSLNRHLRSIAEKSLCSSTSDFIHDDSIYEDTFMKQMQCILDPQDTVLLEDIKPIVMAELNKVLQLNDTEQRFQIGDKQSNYSQYHDYNIHNEYEYEEYPQSSTHDYIENEHNSYQQNSSFLNEIENQENSNEPVRDIKYSEFIQYEESKPLFRRRSKKVSGEYNEERRLSSESRKHCRRSIDGNLNEIHDRSETFSPCNYNQDIRVKLEDRQCSRRIVEIKSNEENFNNNNTALPLFDTNAEQVSEDDDPFAELDKQYHVAVDHNFIETDDVTIVDKTNARRSRTPDSKKRIKEEIKTPDKTFEGIHKKNTSKQKPMANTETNNTRKVKKNLNDQVSSDIKNEIDLQLQTIAQSPIKLESIKESPDSRGQKLPIDDFNQEGSSYISEKNLNTSTKNAINDNNNLDNINVMQEPISENNNISDNVENSDNNNSTIKSSIQSNSRKRSTDQRPSHRKEKRKKSDSTQSETNKQILNKNIIIKGNDCTAKTSEKCENTKSIFNLFFSKNNTNKKDLSKDASNQSNKQLKQKEKSKKISGKEEKKKPSSFSHSIVSPKIDVSNSNIATTTKLETKSKLKTFDMFVEQPRKANIYQAHRNTVSVPKANIKSMEDNKLKQESTSTSSQIMKNPLEPIAKSKENLVPKTIKKSLSKETHKFTKENCSSKFCQTEILKYAVKAIQTDPVTFEKTRSKSNDTFERMKEIDLEIQELLQEKFKLYSSLESKDSCSNEIQTLGMTVLNVTPILDETREKETSAFTLTEDAIVEDFTNIPVEELEQIALESVQEESNKVPQNEKRNLRKRMLGETRTGSQSPTTTERRNRNVKTPNISLIEQIITDDRPLEDIISLDDLEEPPVKTRKKTNIKSVPKKKKTKKAKILNLKAPTPIDKTTNIIKECSVILERADISEFLKPKCEETSIIDNLINETEPEIVIEEHGNDIQFDMLDVSEDIVIGDNCEVKSTEDKDVCERSEVSVYEEVILDNSQSSSDIIAPDTDQSDSVCKMYDFSADENLRRDSITVAGNADAVLAIECIENNFIAACLDGNVYYFSGDGQLITTLRGSNLAVTCLTIVKEKYGTTIYTGSLDSRIRYYDLETGLEKGPECNVLSPIQTMDRAWDTVFVGTRTGFVLQFECKNNMLIPVSTVKFSDQSILSLKAMKEGPRKVLLVAARFENVTVKDAQTGLLLRTLDGPKMTVYTLLYEDGKVYCGTSSHQIHVFDYTSGGHVGTHEGGKGAVCLRAAGGLVFAGCYDGCVYVYREGGCRPLAQLRGPSLMLLSLAIVGTKIIAGYKDRSLYIWKIPLGILQEMIL